MRRFQRIEIRAAMIEPVIVVIGINHAPTTAAMHPRETQFLSSGQGA